MKRWRLSLNGAVLAVLLAGSVGKVAGEPEFEFTPPVTEDAAFGRTLSMLDQERAEYAESLAKYAANLVREREASEDSLRQARRLLAVALHLAPRSREALVVKFQLEKGVFPAEKRVDYNPEVLARLLLTRAQLLAKQDADGEKLLARCFVDLAAFIDPRNEDAVYAYQLQTIDHGELDWKQVTDAKSE